MSGVVIPNLSRTDKAIALKRPASRVTNIINFKSTVFKARPLLHVPAKPGRVSGMPTLTSKAHI